MFFPSCSFGAKEPLSEPPSTINKTSESKKFKKNIDLTSVAKYEVKYERFYGDNNGENIDIEYPQFVNMPDKIVEDHLNEYLRYTLLPMKDDKFTIIHGASKITLSTNDCISGISQGIGGRPGNPLIGNGAGGFNYSIKKDRSLSLNDVVKTNDAFFQSLADSTDVLLPDDKKATNPQYYINKYIDIEHEQTYGMKYQPFFLTSTSIYLIFGSNIEDGDWFAVGVKLN